MSKFKVGQMVVCKNADGYPSRVTLGKIYRVDSIDTGMVRVVSDSGLSRFFSSGRFSARVAEKNQLLPVSILNGVIK
jgi:hypothetical protein